MFEQHASELRLIRYDPRQCGLSGVAEDLSLDAFVRDIHAVLAASGGGPAALIAPVMAAPPAIGFAAAHPDAVSALVLQGPEIDYARRRIVQRALERGTPDHAREWDERIRAPEGLGEDAEPMRKLTGHNLRSWQRLGVKDLMGEAMENWQVNELLPQLACPTLIIHYPDHAFSDGPNVAGRIANARLVVREGANAPAFNPDLDGLTRLVNDFVLEHSAPLVASLANDSPPPSCLSPREREVIRLLAAGSTNAAIAAELVIAPGTVARHVTNILNKTALRNRVELTRYAVQYGLIDD